MTTVAIRHWNSNGSTEVIGDKVYTWVPKHGVSLAYVEEEHVPILLAKRAKICCNQVKAKYSVASPGAISVWEKGSL